MTDDLGVEFRMDVDRSRRFAMYTGIDRYDTPEMDVRADLTEVHARNIAFWRNERPNASSLVDEKMCLFHFWVTHILVESMHAISREIPELENQIMVRIDELLLTDPPPKTSDATNLNGTRLT